MAKQISGEVFTFNCLHSALLPERGQSTAEVYWSNGRSGLWRCAPCTRQTRQNYTRGNGPSGLRGRFQNLLANIKINADRRGYAAVAATPDELSGLWLGQNGHCAACLGLLILRAAVIDHDHVTGQFRGFLCKTCNVAEGQLKDYHPKALAAFCGYLERNRRP